jgi:hypothetical protein
MTELSEYASTTMRAWAHSRGLYVDYHARPDWVIETVTVRREAERLLARARPGVALLWGLALEMDECGATLTGERVCQQCAGRIGSDGRPTVWYWPWRVWTSRSWHTSAPPTELPCGCNWHSDIPTRPDTVSLHWLVRQLASQRSPIVTDWPEQWAVDADAMEANGWGETWLPSQGEPPKPPPSVRVGGIEIPTIDTRLRLRDGTPAGWSRKHDPTPSWMCIWWREFREWVTTGREPDAVELARLLDERTASRRATATIHGEFSSLDVLEYNPRTDDIRDAWASVLGLVQGLNEPDDAFRSRLLATARGRSSLEDIRFAALSVFGVDAVAVLPNWTTEAHGVIPPMTVVVIYEGTATQSAVQTAVRDRTSMGIGVAVWRREHWDARVADPDPGA